jgi:hypothetical protein
MSSAFLCLNANPKDNQSDGNGFLGGCVCESFFRLMMLAQNARYVVRNGVD